MGTYKIWYRKPACEVMKGSVIIRVIHNRRVRNITTKIKIYKKEWEFIEYYLKHPERHNLPPEVENIVLDLMEMLDDLAAVEQRLESKGDYTIEDLLTSFRDYHQYDNLYEFVRLLAGELELAGQERTARAYLSTLNRILDFHGRKSLKYQDINACFVKSFERRLKNEGLMTNTISFYLRNFRAIYNRGLLNGFIPSLGGNPFTRVRIATQHTRKRALSLQQMRRLNGLNFYSLLLGEKEAVKAHKELAPSLVPLYKSLYHAWRLFLFSFHARGMSFVDLAYLKKENIRGNSIVYYRKKTGGHIELKMNPDMRLIIKSFSDDTEESKYIFPIIVSPGKSERKQYESALRRQNSLLKMLARLANIKENITTHVARHTWATIAKRENISVEIISEGLGHSDAKTTGIYLDSFESQTLEKASDRISYAVSNR